MAISFNLIPPDRRVPGQAFEFDSSRAGYFQELTRVVMIGARLPTGTAPAGVLERVQGADQARKQFGRGSMLARMVETFRRNNASAELWVLPVNDVASLPDDLTIDNVDIPIDYVGEVIAAEGRIDYTGTQALAAGIIALYIAGHRVRVTVAKNDGPVQLATKTTVAINLALDLPVTAATEGNGVVLTARHRGEITNQIDLRVNYRGTVAGERLPEGVALAITPMAGGAGDPSMLSALPKLGDEEWSMVICPYTAGDAQTAISEEMASRWHPDRQVYGLTISALIAPVADLLAYGQTLNGPYQSILGVPGCPSTPWEIAAAYGGQAALSLAIDPARPLQTLPLTGILPPALGDRLKIPDANALLYGGIATAMVQSDGILRIQREVTTYRVNEWGEGDPSYLDLNTPATLSYYVRSLRQRLALKFPRAKLAADGARVGPGSALVTPSIIKAEVLAHYSELERQGLMENMSAFAENLIVERAADDPNRVNLLLPPDLVNQLRFIAGVVQFRLEY